ncbi:MAG: galactose mutarotase [Bacteroidales bacterium]|nr:galactose mutarotase [Bacteroidales bacterium]
MKKLVRNSAVVILAILASGCGNGTKEEYKMSKESFGSLDGKEVVLVTLTNRQGNTLKLTNYGATVVWIDVPDRDGNVDNITFGFEDLEGYLNGDPYFGSIVGRYANRIAEGKFSIDGKEYTLAINNDPNTLHGGPEGWHSVVWDYEIVEPEEGNPAVHFRYKSPDMEEGYPGNMEVEAIYEWTDDNEMIITYSATTDASTVFNITNHAYFNLNGAGSGDILDHELTIRAAAFTPVNETLIPTGEIIPVAGTPFDFTSAHRIGERIGEGYDQLELGLGYDHNFVLDNNEKIDAVVYSPKTGRYMEVETDQPGVQFYCGNFLDGTMRGHEGKVYNYRGGLCLETQHFPDSPNQPEFPSTRLDPGDTFRSVTLYRFGVRE